MTSSRSTTVTIGGKNYQLCFSILGIVALRDHWKLEHDDEVLVRLSEISERFKKGKTDFRIASEIIWAGLEENHAGELTPAEVLKGLSALGLDGAAAMLQKAFLTLIAASPPAEARQAHPTKKNRGG